MKQTPDGPLYTIQGEVSSPHYVSDGAKTLVGPIIEFSPGIQHAVVRSTGAMHGVQEARPGAAGKPPTTQPIDVTWQNGLDADGKKNLIVIDGGVVPARRWKTVRWPRCSASR